MPVIRATFLALVIPFSFSTASIDNLEQRFIEEKLFQRISEFFTGVEVPGDRVIIRSEPDFRTGHYVVFSLSESYPVDHFKLEVYEYNSKKPVEYVFKPESQIPPLKPVYLGLTGEKWLEKIKPPVAYKLSLIGKDGGTLTSATSFLWGDD